MNIQPWFCFQDVQWQPWLLDVCEMQSPDKYPCSANNVRWESNKAQTDEGAFTYIKRRCLDCNATSTLGEYKGGGYFWKKWEIYLKDSQSSHPSSQTPPPPPTQQ